MVWGIQMGGEALTSRLGRKAVRMIQTAGRARIAMTVKASQLAPMSRQWMRRRVVGRGLAASTGAGWVCV